MTNLSPNSIEQEIKNSSWILKEKIGPGAQQPRNCCRNESNGTSRQDDSGQEEETGEDGDKRNGNKILVVLVPGPAAQ